MEQKKKDSKPLKAPQTHAEHLRHYKGIVLPERIEGKRAGATLSTRAGGRKGG